MPETESSAGNSSPSRAAEEQLQAAAIEGARSLARQWTTGATTDTLNSSLLTVAAALLTAANKVGWEKTVDVLFELVAANWQFAIVPAMTAAIAFLRKDR